MSAGQRRRRERERAAASADGTGAAGPHQGPQLNEGLAREKAVIELSRLRTEVFDWMEVGLRTKGGRMGSDGGEKAVIELSPAL